MMSTGAEVAAGVSVDSSFNELNTEWLQLVHQVVDGSSVVAQGEHDQRSFNEQTLLMYYR